VDVSLIWIIDKLIHWFKKIWQVILANEPFEKQSKFLEKNKNKKTEFSYILSVPLKNFSVST